MRNYEQYQLDCEHGRNIVTKFIDNFFIKQLMEKSKLEDMGYTENSNDEVERKSTSSQADSSKYDENTDEQQMMSGSFYKKNDLDFLYFQRPGTAYNNPAAFGGSNKDGDSKVASMMGTATRSQFFAGPGIAGKSFKPIEMIKSKT